jgi:hypothetical protein
MLGHWGLSCPASYDQEPEKLQYQLLGCVVAREIWTWALRRWGSLDWLPDRDVMLLEWWTVLEFWPILDQHNKYFINS